MKPSKTPYLVRALYDWILASEYTPYLLVDATRPGVEVPRESVRDGRIVLNVSPVAVRSLVIDDHVVTFDGRFHGASYAVRVPVAACLAIYAHETGEGMMFEPAPREPDPPDDAGNSAGAPGSRLRVVK